MPVSLLSPTVFIGGGWTVSLCDCAVPEARGMGALKIVLENVDSSQLNTTELAHCKYSSTCIIPVKVARHIV